MVDHSVSSIDHSIANLFVSPVDVSMSYSLPFGVVGVEPQVDDEVVKRCDLVVACQIHSTVLVRICAVHPCDVIVLAANPEGVGRRAVRL